jgi:uncharacterized protein YdcH (DUF465 family)
MRSHWYEATRRPSGRCAESTYYESDAAVEQEVLHMNGPILVERMHELELRHRRLHDEVHMLERRVYLTPEEQRRICQLKKEKLIVKDELYQVRRASEPPPPLS